MRIISAAEVEAALDFDSLIERLRQAIRRARVFVDTRAGACTEAGDIVQPLESGVLAPEDIAADLFELTRGERAGRRFYDQITLFKSVGSAIEDLAAAQLTVERA